MTSLASIMPGSSLPSTSSIKREEDMDCQDVIMRLPVELILSIFSYLSIKGLAISSLVSKKWRHMVSDPSICDIRYLTEIYPSFKVIDASDWAQHVNFREHELSTEDEPHIANRAWFISLLKQFSSLPIERKAGITLLTIPKGLNLNKLEEIGRGLTHFGLSRLIKEAIGEIQVKKTYRILITNNVLEESRNKSITEQKALANGLGCTRPKVLEAVALLVMTYLVSKKRLYSDYLLGGTRCEDHPGSPWVVKWDTWNGGPHASSESLYGRNGIGLRKGFRNLKYSGLENSFSLKNCTCSII
jgi:hypothetical protein